MAPPCAPGILLDGVRRRYGATVALDGISVTMEAGEFFVVLGPSGCGKSTLLRTVAGLDRLDEGRIALGGAVVAGPGVHRPPEARGVAVVFQSYALWPHMTVAENIAFPAEANGAGRAAVEGIVREAMEAVALAPFADRRPAALSGGQQQRVALARCLASRARTVLMDEPLANLDPHLRAAMEEELSAFHRRAEATTLYITHDQREAMALASRIAVMDAGRLLQVGTADEVYARPASETVARFVGRGSVLDGTLVRAEGGRGEVRLGGVAVAVHAPTEAREGPVRMLVRPHQVGLREGPFAGRVVRETYRGGGWEVLVEVDGIGAMLVETPGRAGAAVVPVAVDGGWVLPAAL